jgi:GH24 family phage-related lysozyme (muramidase)
VTDAGIEREFASRLRVAERGVERRVTVSLTQAQFDALVSLAYNAGINGCADVFDLVNTGAFDSVAKEIESMTSGHKFVKHKRVPVFYPGLVARRAAEAAPFKNAPNSSSRSAAQ